MDWTRGLLGAVQGAASGIYELTLEQKKQLAERLKMEALEQAQIRAEGRQAQAQEVRDNRQQGFEKENMETRAKLEDARLDKAHGYSMDVAGFNAEKDRENKELAARLEMEGRRFSAGQELAGRQMDIASREKMAAQELSSREKMSGMQYGKTDIAIDKWNMEKEEKQLEKRKQQLLSIADEIGAKSVKGPTGEETVIMTEGQYKALKESGAKMGLSVSAIDTDKTQDRKGWFSGEDKLYELKRITPIDPNLKTERKQDAGELASTQTVGMTPDQEIAALRDRAKKQQQMSPEPHPDQQKGLLSSAQNGANRGELPSKESLLKEKERFTPKPTDSDAQMNRLKSFGNSVVDMVQGDIPPERKIESALESVGWGKNKTERMFKAQSLLKNSDMSVDEIIKVIVGE